MYVTKDKQKFIDNLERWLRITLINLKKTQEDWNSYPPENYSRRVYNDMTKLKAKLSEDFKNYHDWLKEIF